MTRRKRPLLRYMVVAGLVAGPGSSLAAANRVPAYLTSASCAECHSQAYNAWSDSHHGWAWRPATAENVLGDFSAATFEHRGVRSHFSKRDGRYFVQTGGPDGQPTTYEIAGTVGVTPLQQYLVKLDDGRLQALDIVWDTEEGRWYHLYPDQALEHDPGLHWTGPYRNWNSRCVSCHVTGFVKGYEPESDRYQSSWSEMGVGCEACHGPGEAHLVWARQEETQRPGSALLESFAGVNAMGFTVSLAATDPEAEIQRCAGCHSRRESLAADSAPPGEPFADHFRLALLRQGLYHADGQIQDEVYVYGSFLQSKMHARGVSCGDCHQPHNAELDVVGNGVCTQCHNPQGRKDFPTLRLAEYDSPLHHHHSPGSEAAQCVNCHMPEQTYMGVDPRRDHSFRVPRPDLTVTTGVPNVCTSCHADQSAEWAQARVAGWFPQGHQLRPHYGEVFHAARQELNEVTAQSLVDLAMDVAQPTIVRASALEFLAPVATPPIVGSTLPLLTDPSPLLRSTALGLFAAAPAAVRTRHGGPLLDDPLRAVRIAAARQVLDIKTDNLSQTDRAVVENAVAEYHASLSAHADFPEVQLNLARFAATLGQQNMAQRALETALALDPKLAEAWLRLALMEVDEQRFKDAKKTLQRALAEVPSHGALQQLFGRVLARLGDQAAATAAFATALSELPDELEIRVEYVSLLSNLGRHAEALETLAQADQTAQVDPQMLYLLAYNHARVNDMERARHFARELSRRHPESPLNQNLQSVLGQH